MLSIGQASAQNLRMLALLTERRIPDFANVPTATELGFPVVQETTGGVFAPKGIAKPVLEQLENACEAASRSERFLAAAKATHNVVTYMAADAYAKYIAEDFVLKGEIIRRSGIATQ